MYNNKVLDIKHCLPYNDVRSIKYRKTGSQGMERGRQMFSRNDLKKLIIPLVIEQILLMMVGMADTIMVSHAGEAAISGVSLMDMINYLFTTVFAAIATGGAVIVSQYLGSRDERMARESASQLYTIAGLISLVCGGFCLVFCRPILSLLFGSIEEDVMAAAVVYFLVTACSFPFLGIYNAGSALFRSMQKTDVTMYVSLMMNAINVVGNAIGIFALHAGVLGVAIPTLISRMAAALVISGLAFRTSHPIYIQWKGILAWKGETIGRILKIGIPNGIENGLFALGKVLVVSIIALFGTTQIAANGVSNSINQVAIVVVNSINLAIVTVVGQCVGAKDYEQAKKYTWMLMKVSYVSTFILGSLTCLALPLLRGFYELSDETWRLSCILIVMHNGMAAALHPTSFNLPNALRAAGDAKYTMVMGIASMLVFRLGVAVLFGIVFHMGIIGVWIAMGADWFGRSVAFVIRYRSGKWKEFRMI